MKRRTLSATLVVLALAGCGGHGTHVVQRPKLPRLLATQLAARSDRVAQRLDAGDSCGALAAARELRQQAIAAINRHRVPRGLQEQLLGTVNDLTVRIVCVPPAKPERKKEEDHKGRDHGHGGEGEG